MWGVINCRYRLDEQRYLVVSTGEVHVAYDLDEHCPVLVWLLTETHAYYQDLLERDSRAIKSLEHTGTLQPYDYGVDQQTGRLFLVYEYLDCRTLDSVLRDCSPDQLLPCRYTLSVVLKILHTLNAVHREGVVHRRLNPFTVLLWETEVKLAGFGLAYLQKPGRVSLQEALYLAPEQLSGDYGDERADLYSVGVVAFRMFFGRLPFIAADLDELRCCVKQTELAFPKTVHPGVPDYVKSVIWTLLRKEPDRRFQTAVEVYDALDVGAGTRP